MTKAEVIDRAKALKVRFLHLEFSDILGIVKSVAVPVEQLESALNNGIRFDGSSIQGFVRLEESDMILMPDPTTFAIYPWSDTNGPTGRLICDIYRANGQPFEGCPRLTLKKIVEELQSCGLRSLSGTEIEFYLFELDADGYPTVRTKDQCGYFDLYPADRGDHARRDMVIALQEMGVLIEASHHENSPGQHEMDLQATDVLTACDSIMTLRTVVRFVAREHDLHGTFMPKPIESLNGSGLHVNISLYKGQKNIFASKTGEPTPAARHFTGGILNHALGMSAIACPLVNSYKRLVPGFEAPLYTCWSVRGRSPYIRIPASNSRNAFIEVRNPDPSCNPYLAYSLILAGGCRGIRSLIEPPPSIEGNPEDLSAVGREKAGALELPKTLYEAVDHMSHDEFVKDTLGESIYTRYIAAKRIEWEMYRSQVDHWEIEQYLNRF